MKNPIPPFLFAVLLLAAAVLACNLPGRLAKDVLPQSKDENPPLAAGADSHPQVNVPPGQGNQSGSAGNSGSAGDPGAPPAPLNTCTQWYVTGLWKVTQKNNYHPTFQISQTGTELVGTVFLTGAEAKAQDFSSNIASGTGSVQGNVFSFTVTWPERVSDGVVVSGTYTGLVSENSINSKDWTGIGHAECVKYKLPAP